MIRHGTVESDDDGLHAREVVREGPAGLVTTTTQVTLHPENETRLLSVTVDDSAAQTKRVMLAIADQNSESARPDLDEWHTLQWWLEDYERDVVVPFAVTIAQLIPPIATRLRRDAGIVLGLIRAHALLHRASRRIIDGRVIATLADYEVVRDLVADIISDTLGQSVSPATRDVVDAVDSMTTNGAKHVTYAQLAQHFKLDKSSVSRRARVAVTGGYLRNEEEKKGKPARLVIGDPLPEDVLVLPTVDQVADRCSVAVQSELPPTPGVRSTSDVEHDDYANRHRRRQADDAWGAAPKTRQAVPTNQPEEGSS